MIYFAERCGLIKIGCSKNPKNRSYALQATVLGVMDGHFDEERLMHQRFEHLHCIGEWFFDSPEIREYVEDHCTLDFRDSRVELRISLPKDLDDQIRAMAKADRRSFSNMVNVLLHEQLNRQKESVHD